jgi:hypothetical protein
MKGVKAITNYTCNYTDIVIPPTIGGTSVE